MLDINISLNISELLDTLTELYPKETFGSRGSIFREGYNEGLITEQEFETAKKYYGRLWNYCGDWGRG